jgi:hypothetical protein
MGRFYLVPENRLVRRRSGKPKEEAGGSWETALQAFEGTRTFARAKFLSSLLKNVGVVPDGGDVLRLEDAVCSGTILLRNLANNKTVLSKDTKRFLKRLRERSDVPEAKDNDKLRKIRRIV